MVYLDVIPAFEIALYTLVTALFVVTGLLNLRDLRAIRQENWTRQDTVALILRTFFFAFLFNLVLIVIVTGGILVSFVVLSPSITLEQVIPVAVTSLEFSFATFLVTGIIYGIAKWKDWYDLVDAED